MPDSPMSIDILVLSPPSEGGVEDHTRRLLSSWRRAGLEVERWDGVGAPARTRALLIQYVPFLYHQRGLSSIPEEACHAARDSGARIGLMVHEPWVPLTRIPWWILGPLQRWQLHRLRRAVDFCVSPVPAWAAKLGAEVLPVGATVPVPREGLPSEPDLPWTVFSPFASGLRWDWIAQAVNPEELVVVGATHEDLQRHRSTARYVDSRWTAMGRVAGTDVVPTLARAFAVLAPFIDGITTRRTSAMASLAAGTPVVSSRGPLYDPFFDDSPVRLADSLDEFREELMWVQQEPRGVSGTRRWFDAHLGAERLDRRLADLLLS